MLITGTLLPIVGRMRWRWPVPAVVAFVLVFIGIDLSYVAGNAFKIVEGGWLPLVIAAAIFTMMTTWKTGRRLVAERLTARAFPLEEFVAGIAAHPPTRVDGTAVFMTAQPTGTPAALVHNLRYNKVLHEHVIVLTVSTVPVPYVAAEERIKVEAMGHGLDRKSTRLNSSHSQISYAVFCLKKK